MSQVCALATQSLRWSEAEGEESILARRALFDPIYERGAIVEVVPRSPWRRIADGAEKGWTDMLKTLLGLLPASVLLRALFFSPGLVLGLAVNGALLWIALGADWEPRATA